MSSIWIVDDDPSIRFVLEKALMREALPVRSFSRTEDVVAALDAAHQGALHERPGVLVSDIRMPGETGLQLLETMHARYPEVPVIIMTAYSDLDSAVSAFQLGAFEYLPKPFDLPKAVALIRRAMQENAAQPVQAGEAIDSAAMLGQAPAMQEVFRAIGRLSASVATVLITGESGSGKELVARALHKHSPVASGPFIAINTAAIPKDLLEAELFGHERGAFTGAQALRKGRFEQAAGGTLFLDEIGDMPLELQTRLLRVLSEGQFYRVGGHAAVHSHVRVIAATHQDLELLVEQGVFREDLFHRLNVIRLRLPSLRERVEDIPLLAQHFLQRSARQLGVETKYLTKEALLQLVQYAFPGNVRQLENMCHWLTVMTPAQHIAEQDMPAEVFSEKASKVGVTLDASALSAIDSLSVEPQQCLSMGAEEPYAVATRAAGWEELLQAEAHRLLQSETPDIWKLLSQRFEACLLTTALELSQGKRIEAAARLGIGRNTVTRKLQELKLESDSPASGCE